MQTIWTDPVFTRFKELAAARWSASKIADKLRIEYGVTVTRSAVIGKSHRSGIPILSVGYNIRAPGDPERGVKRKERDLNRRLRIKRERIREALREAKPKEIPMKRKTLMELGRHDCRCPIGEPQEPGFFFCGGHVVEGLPYCSGHARICYATPGRPKPHAIYHIRKVTTPSNLTIARSMDKEELE